MGRNLRGLLLSRLPVLEERQMDDLENMKTVLFVGDYFALTTTVLLSEELRHEGESDDDLAIRLASVLMEEHYGFEALEDKSNEIGVIDD